jgi:hypothetical protein
MSDFPLLPPGRKLDALVADKIFDWRPTGHPELCIPDYSTSWDAAHLIVEKMRKGGWLLLMEAVDCVGAWAVSMSDGDGRYIRMEGDTLPHAVCLSALEAKDALARNR